MENQKLKITPASARSGAWWHRGRWYALAVFMLTSVACIAWVLIFARAKAAVVYRFTISSERDVVEVCSRLAESGHDVAEFWLLGGESQDDVNVLWGALTDELSKIDFVASREVGRPIWDEGGVGLLALFIRDPAFAGIVAFEDWEEAVAGLWAAGIPCVCVREVNYLIVVPEDLVGEAREVLLGLEGVRVYDENP